MACLDLHKCLIYPSPNVKLIIDLDLLQIFQTIHTVKIKSFSDFPITELLFNELLFSFNILHCLRMFNVRRNTSNEAEGDLTVPAPDKTWKGSILSAPAAQHSTALLYLASDQAAPVQWLQLLPAWHLLSPLSLRNRYDG